MSDALSLPAAALAHGAPAPRTLPAITGSARIARRTEAAWTSLKPTLEHIVAQLGASAVLEVGGGRHPFFSVEEARRGGFQLTVNDIDEAELRHAPGAFDRLVLDIAQPIDHARLRGRSFDLIFSRMVFEHVKDARTAWSNLHALLAPGGVALAFVPTLYSPPFVLNRILPDWLSGGLLRMMDKTRTSDNIPKFPAYYKACRASEDQLRPFLQGIGFSEVLVVPFYGTPYMPRIPVLRQAFRGFDRLIERRNLTAFASYAYIVARR